MGTKRKLKGFVAGSRGFLAIPCARIYLRAKQRRQNSLRSDHADELGAIRQNFGRYYENLLERGTNLKINQSRAAISGQTKSRILVAILQC
jgi:hypothetical protein